MRNLIFDNQRARLWGLINLDIMMVLNRYSQDPQDQKEKWTSVCLHELGTKNQFTGLQGEQWNSDPEGSMKRTVVPAIISLSTNIVNNSLESKLKKNNSIRYW